MRAAKKKRKRVATATVRERAPSAELQRAIKSLGGRRRASVKLRVAKSTLDQWLNGARPLPIPRAYLIEKMSRGKFVCERLLPAHRAMFTYFRKSKSGERPSTNEEHETTMLM